MHVVTGCPRSGTSLAMRILESAFGKERILSAGEPKKAREPKRSEIQQYIFDKVGKGERKASAARAKDMNPNGFYEMGFCVRGIFYSPENEQLLNDDLTTESPKIVKVVSQGLSRSDPRHIHKIIYMARDPRAVAKSQERLGRSDPMNPEDAPRREGKPVLVRSAGMFCRVTVAAARWIVAHPSIPVHVVNYDDLIDNPQATLSCVEGFFGEGDFSAAHELIDTGLRRSDKEPLEDEVGAFAMALFELLKVGDFEGIVAAERSRIEDLKNNPKTVESWYCPRLNQNVAVQLCDLCRGHKQTTLNLIQNAERMRIDWRYEPCPYECGIQGGPGLSVMDSIEVNHWAASIDF